MDSSDLFTAQIDEWFAEQSLRVRAQERVRSSKPNTTLSTTTSGTGTASAIASRPKVDFAVSKVLRSISDFEAAKKKRSGLKGGGTSTWNK
jgi:hypothetical protein